MAPKKKLKSGFTTGTAAAAAVKGALFHLVNGRASEKVRIPFLSEGFADIQIKTSYLENNKTAVCTVIKDGGDDPDVTHGAEIGAKVWLKEDLKRVIVITGGLGVGRVTKPGLGIDIGNAAINSGPIEMIEMAVSDVLGEGHGRSVEVEIFVPGGEKIAEKTLNARLGILGGISILGTTGVVRPMSHDAYIATIKSSISVATAGGVSRLIFTTGRRSERFSMGLWPDLPEESFIQIGDFFKVSLESAKDAGIKEITLAVFFGKAVKMAQAVPHTHAAKSTLSLKKLSQWAMTITGDKDLVDKILNANTARHAFDFLVNDYPEVINHVGRLMVRAAEGFIGKQINIQSVIFDFEGNRVFSSELDNI